MSTIKWTDAVNDYYQIKRGVTYDPKCILAVDSAASGIHLVCKTLLNKGDEAIIFDPVDFLFKYSIEKVGGRAIDLPVSLNPEVSIDLEKLSSLITPKTKLLCLCNPLNPTGKVSKSAIDSFFPSPRQIRCSLNSGFPTLHKGETAVTLVKPKSCIYLFMISSTCVFQIVV